MTLPLCQTIKNDGETRCGEIGTYSVFGLPGNQWHGYHCAEHTRSMVTNYDHQGGCIVRVMGQVCQNCNGNGNYWTEWSDAAERDPEMRALVLEYPDPADGTVCIKCSDCGGTGRKP